MTARKRRERDADRKAREECARILDDDGRAREAMTAAALLARIDALIASGDLEADLVAALRALRVAVEKIEKIASWNERQAAKCQTDADACNFGSLSNAFAADARNHEAMAKDQRAALAEIARLLEVASG